MGPWGEDPGKVQGEEVGADEAFLAQFIGKTCPLVLGDGIDAVSGATSTSSSVVEAVNSAIQ